LREHLNKKFSCKSNNFEIPITCYLEIEENTDSEYYTTDKGPEKYYQ
ncbi:6622_t:CDS:1, partial [Diversispora eburnea]